MFFNNKKENFISTNNWYYIVIPSALIVLIIIALIFAIIGFKKMNSSNAYKGNIEFGLVWVLSIGVFFVAFGLYMNNFV